MKILLSLIYEENGQGLVEYSLILSLIALVVFAVVQLFGESVVELYDTVIMRWP